MLTDGLTDRRTMDAGVIGILIAHLGAFGSGELKRRQNLQSYYAIRKCTIFYGYDSIIIHLSEKYTVFINPFQTNGYSYVRMVNYLYMGESLKLPIS